MAPIDPGTAAGVGKAVEKAVDKAAEVLKGDPEDRAALRKIGEQSGELEPAAQARARRQAVTQHVLLKCVQPLGRLAGVPKDYFNFKFAEDMAEKLKDVPEEELVEPKGSVAGPAIQGMWFALDEPELKEMYLKLLATASDRRTQDRAHPSFAEVIRQLSAEEAEVLASILQVVSHPIIEIRRELDTPNSYVVIATHVMNWQRFAMLPDGTRIAVQVAAPERAMFIDNWIRLGLVSVDYLTSLSDTTKYSWTETTPQVLEARKEYDVSEEAKKIICQHGRLTVTDFGRAFYRAVIEPPSPPKQLEQGDDVGS